MATFQDFSASANQANKQTNMGAKKSITMDPRLVDTTDVAATTRDFDLQHFLVT